MSTRISKDLIGQFASLHDFGNEPVDQSRGAHVTRGQVVQYGSGGVAIEIQTDRFWELSLQELTRISIYRKRDSRGRVKVARYDFRPHKSDETRGECTYLIASEGAVALAEQILTKMIVEANLDHTSDDLREEYFEVSDRLNPVYNLLHP